ncbi:MAG: hypothetical protein SVX43_07210, partial [Cyanobacteriota bacterium]|nr:hypothetical protein [Cyanobacteriota bacterium]
RLKGFLDVNGGAIALVEFSTLPVQPALTPFLHAAILAPLAVGSSSSRWRRGENHQWEFIAGATANCGINVKVY